MASHDRCAAGAGGPQSGCYDVVDHIEHASDLLDLYKVQSSMSSEEGAAAPRHPGRGGGMTAAPDRTAGIGGGLPARTRVATAPVRPSVGMLARVARPVAGVGNLLLVEILSNPRARAAALELARSLGRRLAMHSAHAALTSTNTEIVCTATIR